MRSKTVAQQLTSRIREFIGSSQLGIARNGGCYAASSQKDKTASSPLPSPPVEEREKIRTLGSSNARTGNSGGSRDEVFASLAREAFEFQFQRNEPYRRFCLARTTTPESLRSWREIPAIPTAAFKEFEVTALPEEDRTSVFHSSGTTEQTPSRHFHNKTSLELYEESLWRWFSAHLLKEGTNGFQLVILTPPGTQAANSSLVHMFEVVRRNLGQADSVFVASAESGGWSVDFERAFQALQNSEQPLLVIGTAFSFVHLLDWMSERHLKVTAHRTSRVMETGGYKGRSRAISKSILHQMISERLGVAPWNIVSEYGMSELSSQAYDCVATAREKQQTRDQSRIFHFPPWARAEIISPESGSAVAEGETGLLRAYDLANLFSAMAIQTEDLAIRRGNGFELLGRAESAELRGCSLMNLEASV